MILRPLELQDQRSRGRGVVGRGVCIGRDTEVHERSRRRCNAQAEKIISAKVGRPDPTCTVTEWGSLPAWSLAEHG